MTVTELVYLSCNDEIRLIIYGNLQLNSFYDVGKESIKKPHDILKIEILCN